MSRIGNKLITVPAGVTVEVAAGNEVTVKGPKGSLTRTFSSLMEIHVEENVVTVKRQDDKHHKTITRNNSCIVTQHGSWCI